MSTNVISAIGLRKNNRELGECQALFFTFQPQQRRFLMEPKTIIFEQMDSNSNLSFRTRIIKCQSEENFGLCRALVTEFSGQRLTHRFEPTELEVLIDLLEEKGYMKLEKKSDSLKKWSDELR
jgi:hypothetical protein